MRRGSCLIRPLSGGSACHFTFQGEAGTPNRTMLRAPTMRGAAARSGRHWGAARGARAAPRTFSGVRSAKGGPRAALRRVMVEGPSALGDRLVLALRGGLVGRHRHLLRRDLARDEGDVDLVVRPT